MKPAIPAAFLVRMERMLHDEFSDFLKALDEQPVRGIRINALKRTDAVYQYAGSDPVPWAKDAYYLSSDSNAGATALHEAGAFYIQEPAAMMPASVLDARPGETILDLCAAPGGKSTQIGCAMEGKGLLVCNEPVFKRAQILSRNIERTGLPNTVVTCAWPDRLASQWPEGFDAVLADVPCSGEGMFRRDPSSRNEWTAEKAHGCALRQREILSQAARLVRPGGRMVYSTCTYNPEENEENAIWFLKQFTEFGTESFILPGVNAPNGMFVCYPHRLPGEGQFVALFRKKGTGKTILPADQSLVPATSTDRKTVKNAFPALPEATHMFGTTLVSIPFLPDLKGISALRIGLHLAEIHGKAVKPDHASALWYGIKNNQIIDLSSEQVQQYFRGETLSSDQDGWILLRYRGIAVGWGKGSGGIIRNHYPKGLRNVHILS